MTKFSSITRTRRGAVARDSPICLFLADARRMLDKQGASSRKLLRRPFVGGNRKSCLLSPKTNLDGRPRRCGSRSFRRSARTRRRGKSQKGDAAPCQRNPIPPSSTIRSARISRSSHRESTRDGGVETAFHRRLHLVPVSPKSASAKTPKWVHQKSTDGFGQLRRRKSAFLPDSAANNPEPEIVLVSRVAVRSSARRSQTTSTCVITKAASALLLGERPKTRNGSCSIGPFFDCSTTRFHFLGTSKQCGSNCGSPARDGFTTCGRKSDGEISRSPAKPSGGPMHRDHHSIPGRILVLFLGTMFGHRPEDPRRGAGEGSPIDWWTASRSASPALGRLVQFGVNHTDKIRGWDYGIADLFEYLNGRDGRNIPNPCA